MHPIPFPLHAATTICSNSYFMIPYPKTTYTGNIYELLLYTKTKTRTARGAQHIYMLVFYYNWEPGGWNWMFREVQCSNIILIFRIPSLSVRKAMPNCLSRKEKVGKATNLKSLHSCSISFLTILHLFVALYPWQVPNSCLYM
jgi:hypothetical protein